MTKTSKYASVPYDAADYLTTPEQVKLFLEAALEENDPDFFVEALGIAARSLGMAQIASTSGLGRESLYKALGAGKRPQFSTVYKVISAMGLKMQLAA
jgi:probable addiction module antidote protein